MNPTYCIISSAYVLQINTALTVSRNIHTRLGIYFCDLCGLFPNNSSLNFAHRKVCSQNIAWLTNADGSKQSWCWCYQHCLVRMAIGRYNVHLHITHLRYQQKDAWHIREVVKGRRPVNFTVARSKAAEGTIRSISVYIERYLNTYCAHWGRGDWQTLSQCTHDVMITSLLRQSIIMTLLLLCVFAGCLDAAPNKTHSFFLFQHWSK